MAAKVFTLLAEAGVNVDMIVQASASTGTADISFTVPGSAAAKVRDVLQEKQDELGYQPSTSTPTWDQSYESLNAFASGDSLEILNHVMDQFL